MWGLGGGVVYEIKSIESDNTYIPHQMIGHSISDNSTL